MNEAQKEKLADLSKDRHPVYRVYSLDEDGTYLDDRLCNCLSGVDEFIENHSDVIGVTLIVEVIQ